MLEVEPALATGGSTGAGPVIVAVAVAVTDEFVNDVILTVTLPVVTLAVRLALRGNCGRTERRQVELGDGLKAAIPFKPTSDAVTGPVVPTLIEAV